MSNSRSSFLNICLHFGRLLLPWRCVLCDGASESAAVCAACWKELPFLSAQRCGICALPIAHGAICGACLAHPPYYDHVSAPFVYAFPVDALIHAFKYRGNLAIAQALAPPLAATVAEPADLIVPMPLAPGRLRERGFNQALELARYAGRMTGITVAADICRKVVDTPPQAVLPWRERAQNVRRAFVCDANLSHQHVAVVDDVMTTGATMNELAKNLKRAGATRVSAWVVARAVPR